jgi:hypothetical protein
MKTSIRTRSTYGILDMSTSRITVMPENINTCELLASHLLRREMHESDIPTFEVDGKQCYTKQSYRLFMNEWAECLTENSESDVYSAENSIDVIANNLIYSKHKIINMKTNSSLSSKEKEQTYNAIVEKLNSKL